MPLDLQKLSLHEQGCGMSWLKLVIFDCDGVLIDSESLSAKLLQSLVVQYGGTIDVLKLHSFMGRRWSDIQPEFEEVCGLALGADWPVKMQEQLLALSGDQGLPLCPGAHEALIAVRNAGLPFRIASNSSRAELDGKFLQAGLMPLVAGRYHSSGDHGQRGKPAPDVYLSAARAENILPQYCLAIEDSVPGVKAAIAAGMRCLGYGSGDHGKILADFGAQPFTSLFEFPGILQNLLREQAA